MLSIQDSLFLTQDSNNISKIIDYIDKNSSLDEDDSNNHNRIFIMDPYFSFDSFICKPFHKKRYDSKTWSNLITAFCFNVNSFYILTETVVLSTIYQKQKNIYQISHPENNNCLINLSIYDNSKHGNMPSSLHDRWLLIEKNNIGIGFHIGCSLGHINNKDILITMVLGEGVVSNLKNRFNYIWKKSTGENINDI